MTDSRDRWSARRTNVFRAYSIALGFALGQVAPMLPHAARPRPAIVRDLEQEFDPDGFHPLERGDRGVVLTMPYSATGSRPGSGADPDRTKRLNLN